MDVFSIAKITVYIKTITEYPLTKEICVKLTPSNSYRIEGSWFELPSRLANPKPIQFQGKLFLKHDKRASGVIFDLYGPAIIAGKVATVGVSDSFEKFDFTKTYDQDYGPTHTHAHKGPIINDVTFAYWGGFGIWRIPEIQKTGRVTMAVVPWDEMFPISHELQDYLATHPDLGG